MIQLKNVTLRRSAKVLLDAASVTLNPGEKVGLVGRNGAGKSTLFALFNGSLAVLCAMAYPEIEVVGADISKDALAVAKINVDQHQLSHRIQLVESDGLQGLTKTFDCIICNPPYVCEASMQGLPAEFKAEPLLALAGGTDGMDFIRQLFIDLPDRMNHKAILVLEIGNEREHFEAAFPRLEAVWLETSAGEDQVLLLTKEALLKIDAKS